MRTDIYLAILSDQILVGGLLGTRQAIHVSFANIDLLLSIEDDLQLFCEVFTHIASLF